MIHIYSIGLCYCSVCAEKDKSVEEITSELNYQRPTGIASNWQLSEDNFASGAANPCQCHDDPNRLHYLFEC